MTMVQQGIMEPLPANARYLFFTLRPDSPADQLRSAIENLPQQKDLVIGLGQSLIQQLGTDLPGLHPFPALTHQGIDVPSTPAALWIWLRGVDRGELLHRSRIIEYQLAEVLELEQVTDAFVHEGGKDLTGYEDGTENPEGEDAVQAAIAHQPEALQGSSFVAVQQWLHDLDAFEAMPQTQQDHTIGRRKSDNEELDDAPESAHVKRTAQESFVPEAFMLRRSMPWVTETGSGLMFVAFGRSLEAFEAQMRRMLGLDDGTVDALFRFTRPITGSYFWCPPIKDKKLDLSALDL
ncbi:Dyp-type peroxidase [Motiliproteus sp. MSK22-1]|uniref:Dyp-type peroxidase n=1 Tax=Motiliproteus sp. MSK22-1 TaxID=1897630 RepID=UPI000975F581|nr:Dyp-type peroxidase [Motiliproteus sp. MSK22-1]OMH39056.1 peroxidase [Motiliproteus sp. MSK22-1]